MADWVSDRIVSTETPPVSGRSARKVVTIDHNWLGKAIQAL